jgi:hypothetical protein
LRHEAIKKHEGQWVKIRPALQIYDHAGALEQAAVEDAWCVTEITSTSLKLMSRDTELSKVLGLDHVHHYMEDPEGQRTLETAGMLVLNVQLLLYQGSLHAEPVAPPGSPLKAFVPAKPRASLLDSAAKMRARTHLEQARKQFDWSPEGVNSASKAFTDFGAEFERLGNELQAAGHPIEDLNVRTFHPNGPILLRAAGWWLALARTGYSSNYIGDGRLVVRQLDGPPKWPGLMVFDEPKKVWEETYRYGLAALGAPRWMAESNPDLSYTTSDLAQELLTKLCEQPNKQR